MASQYGVGLVVKRLREALKQLPQEQLVSAFHAVDTNNSGSLSAAELKQALAMLGFKVSANELDDLLDFFDTDGSGDVSVDEFVSFANTADDVVGSSSGSEGETVTSIVNRVRAVLMAYGPDSLAGLFKGKDGSMRELTAGELSDALHGLGVPGLRPEEVTTLLRRMDENNDGVVSFAELSAFLQQKAFAEGVRKVMQRCAAVLKAQGTTLQRELERAARRALRETVQAGAQTQAQAGARTGTGTGIPTITPAVLERVLVHELGFPLSSAQVSAVVAMGDLDGSGDCDMEEVLYLAGEEYEEDEGGQQGRGTGMAAGDENEEPGGKLVGVSPSKNRGPGTSSRRGSALSSLQQALGVVLVMDGGEGQGGEGTGEASGVGMDDFFTPTEDASAQLYGPSSGGSASGGGEAITEGRSRLDGLPMDALQPGAPSPAAAWCATVDSVFQAWASPAAPAAAGAGQVEAGAGAMAVMELGRVHTALAALGVYLQPSSVAALATRLQPTGDSSSSGGSGGSGSISRVSAVQFRVLSDLAILAAHEAGRGGLSPLAECRVRNALRALGQPIGSGHPVGRTGEDAVLTRHGLACALLRVPGAGLTPAEAIAVAAHAPGAQQGRALALVHAHVHTNAASAGIGAGSSHSRAPSTGRDTEQGFTLHGAGRAGLGNAGLYPADISLLHLCARTPLGSFDPYPDVLASRVLSWLKVLAGGGAALRLCYPPEGTAQGVDTFALPVALAFAQMDPVARAGVSKLCAGQVTLPCPLTRLTLPVAVAGQGGGQGLGVIAAGGSTALAVGKPAGSLSSSFVSLAGRLPGHAVPSLLAPLCYSHPWLALGRRHLLDGGWDADPGNLYSTGRAAGVVLCPGSETAGQLAKAPASHPLLLTSFTTAAGQAADGFGLTLRLTSILPGSEEMPTGCLPTGAGVTDKSRLLRPVGAAVSGAGDLQGWAGEGSAVRGQGALLTAVLALTEAVAIPLPREEAVRRLIVGRVVRVALVDVSTPQQQTGGSSSTPAPGGTPPLGPRVRVLSNVLAVPATWSASSEDVWTFPDPSTLAGALSKLVLRCDQPRDGSGPGAVSVLLELCTLMPHPAAGAQQQQYQQGAAYDGSSSEPYEPSPLAQPDMYPCEEITVAWATLPLAGLAGEKGDSTLTVPLQGGSPMAPVPISPADISQKRSGFSALARSISRGSSSVPIPSLHLSVTRLSKLKKKERQACARLPFTVVTPWAWMSALEAFRVLYADRILQSSYAHAQGRVHPLLHAGAAVFEALATVAGPAGNTTAIGTLGKAVQDEMTARKNLPANSKVKNTYEAVLQDILTRTWAVAASAGEGIPPGPGVELVERALGLSGGVGVGVGGRTPTGGVGAAAAMTQLLGSGAVATMRPLNAAEQLA